MLNDHEDHLSGAGKEVMLVPGGLLEIRCGDSSLWRRPDPVAGLQGRSGLHPLNSGKYQVMMTSN
jgi:hypothetical protein